jgi:hypothetical protein
LELIVGLAFPVPLDKIPYVVRRVTLSPKCWNRLVNDTRPLENRIIQQSFSPNMNRSRCHSVSSLADSLAACNPSPDLFHPPRFLGQATSDVKTDNHNFQMECVNFFKTILTSRLISSLFRLGCSAGHPEYSNKTWNCSFSYISR